MQLRLALVVAVATSFSLSGCGGGSSDDGGPTCTPVAETCNGADDDCDALIDEDFAAKGDACSAGVGACTVAGVLVCSGDGAGVVCDAVPGTPTDELCDGIDNDCDAGTPDGADEATIGTACDGIDADLCPEGTIACSAGVLVCTDPNDDDLELCDGIDNDCDPATPDGADEATVGAACDGLDSDLCKEGTFACASGNLLCSDETGDVVETCNGLDDDCDGVVDSPISPGPDICLKLGECTGTDASCVDGGWRCVYTSPGVELDGSGNVLAVEQRCDGSDGNCNGQVDESFPDLGQPCDDGQVGVCKSTGTMACSGDQSSTLCNITVPGQPASAELCDGRDNDCDGATDEDLLGPACPKQAGVCAGSRLACGGTSGWLACDAATYAAYSAGYEPAETLCDGRDNDCDGMTDEALTRSCYDGPPATLGVGACVAGSSTCISGTYGACAGQVLPTTEACADGVDNDCDGLTDAADPDCPWAHTVTIDGVNDFTAAEQFATTSGGYTGWITWDATYLFVGYQGAAISSPSPNHRLLVYLAGTGAGATTGITLNTQQPDLPFAATHCAQARLDLAYSSLWSYDGSAWADSGVAMQAARSGTFMELRIPRAALGSPATLSVHVSVVDETPFAEWTWGGVPSDSFTDSYDPNYARSFGFDLAAQAAPASYVAQ